METRKVLDAFVPMKSQLLTFKESSFDLPETPSGPALNAKDHRQ
jgi:hypothetical protein